MGAVFLGFASFLWLCAGAYVSRYFAGKPRERSVSVFWQLTLAGSHGVFVALDTVTFYVSFAFLSLSAYVLAGPVAGHLLALDRMVFG